MPWKIERDPEGCSEEKPWAVKKEDDGEVVGCHMNEDAAKAQVAALNASESEGRARPRTGAVETRRFEISTEGRKIRGVLPYNVESRDMGGWKEIIDPGALRQTNLDELVARVDHAGVPIGRYPTTLELEDRADGSHGP
jgi:hypothetical protein